MLIEGLKSNPNSPNILCGLFFTVSCLRMNIQTLRISLIVSKQGHILRSGWIRWSANDQFPWSVYWMQEKLAGIKIERLWQGPDCYGKVTRSEYLKNGKACGLLLVSSGENLPTVSEEGQTTNRQQGVGPKTQGSSMHEGNGGFPIWSKPTEGLL